MPHRRSLASTPVRRARLLLLGLYLLSGLLSASWLARIPAVRVVRRQRQAVASAPVPAVRLDAGPSLVAASHPWRARR